MLTVYWCWREETDCYTGRFELVYKQVCVCPVQLHIAISVALFPVPTQLSSLTILQEMKSAAGQALQLAGLCNWPGSATGRQPGNGATAM